jgi:hypothetical protein
VTAAPASNNSEVARAFYSQPKGKKRKEKIRTNSKKKEESIIEIVNSSNTLLVFAFLGHLRLW